MKISSSRAIATSLASSCCKRRLNPSQQQQQQQRRFFRSSPVASRGVLVPSNPRITIQSGSRKNRATTTSMTATHSRCKRMTITRRTASNRAGPPNNNSNSNNGGGGGRARFDPRYAAGAFGTGVAAGFAGSLAGMGGGFVMIPLMTSPLLRLTQHQAHGTSLFAVAATGAAGALSYGPHVRWDYAAAVALLGMASARAGARVTGAMSERALKRALGVLMLAMAPAVPLKAYILRQHYEQQKQQQQSKEQQQESETATATATATTSEDNDDREEAHNFVRRFLPPAMIGLGSGFLAGVFGVGGGVIVVPALAVATDMNHYQALATSLAAMTPPAAVGTYAHHAAGNVAMRVAPFLACGAFCGAYVGARVASRTDETTLRWGFSGLLAVLGAQTILKTL